MEQKAGLLPPLCPRVVIDYTGEISAGLPKMSAVMEWGRNRRFRLRTAEPCILHANGPSKYLTPVAQWWIDRKEAEAPPLSDWGPYSKLWAGTVATQMANHYWSKTFKDHANYTRPVIKPLGVCAAAYEELPDDAFIASGVSHTRISSVHGPDLSPRA